MYSILEKKKCEEAKGESRGVGFSGFTSLPTQHWVRASSKDTCRGRKLSLPVLLLGSGSENRQNRLAALQPDTIHMCARPHIRGLLCTPVYV